jgi:hypothetical protein
MNLLCLLLIGSVTLVASPALAQNQAEPIEIQKVYAPVYRGEVYRHNGRRVGTDRLVFVTAFVPEANHHAQRAQKLAYLRWPLLLVGSFALTRYTVVPPVEGPGPRWLGTGVAVGLLGAGFHLSTRSEIHQNNAVYLYNNHLGQQRFP